LADFNFAIRIWALFLSAIDEVASVKCKTLLSAFMTILCGITVCAQMVTSNLQGTVTDPSGAVVAGSSVTAANLETGLQRTTTTNSEGFYRFTSAASR